MGFTRAEELEKGSVCLIVVDVASKRRLSERPAAFHGAIPLSICSFDFVKQRLANPVHAYLSFSDFQLKRRAPANLAVVAS